jgi:hypothetical protein
MRLNLDERSRDVLAAIPCIGLYFGLQYVMQEERAFAVSLAVYVFYVIVTQQWARRHDRRFWLTITVFALVHVLVLSVIKFPHYSGPSLISAPFVVADGLAMWWILNLLEKPSSKP